MTNKEVFDFLSKLKENNNREWFDKNRPLFLRAKESFENSIGELIGKLSKFEPELGVLAPKDCIFRIYRDVRFSKDKSPYKPNFGAFISRGGRKSAYAGYYLHIENGKSFLGGGVYMPPAEVLKSVRTDVYNFTDEFKAIINKANFKTYFGKLDDSQKLKRPPKDFPKDFLDVDLLKYKSYVCLHSLSDEEVSSEHLVSNAVQGFKRMQPLNSFLNEAIANKGE